MKNLLDINANIKFGRDSATTNNVTDRTAAQIEMFSARGYEIIVGNNPFLDKAPKYAGRKCYRIAQVNSRVHGFCQRTIWAVK
jgi:hypothetical protein